MLIFLHKKQNSFPFFKQPKIKLLGYSTESTSQQYRKQANLWVFSALSILASTITNWFFGIGFDITDFFSSLGKQEDIIASSMKAPEKFLYLTKDKLPSTFNKEHFLRVYNQALNYEKFYAANVYDIINKKQNYSLNDIYFLTQFKYSSYSAWQEVYSCYNQLPLECKKLFKWSAGNILLEKKIPADHPLVMEYLDLKKFDKVPLTQSTFYDAVRLNNQIKVWNNYYIKPNINLAHEDLWSSLDSAAQKKVLVKPKLSYSEIIQRQFFFSNFTESVRPHSSMLPNVDLRLFRFNSEFVRHQWLTDFVYSQAYTNKSNKFSNIFEKQSYQKFWGGIWIMDNEDALKRKESKFKLKAKTNLLVNTQDISQGANN